jgi:hypothetical protein
LLAGVGSSYSGNSSSSIHGHHTNTNRVRRIRSVVHTISRSLARRVFELHRGEQNKRKISQQRGLLHAQR